MENQRKENEEVRPQKKIMRGKREGREEGKIRR
jgi:hypothetical protein